MAAPADLERAVAQALRARVFDQQLADFWPQRAKDLDGHDPAPAEIAALGDEWCRFAKEIACELIRQTESEAARIRDRLDALPEQQRDAAWDDEWATLNERRPQSTTRDAGRLSGEWRLAGDRLRSRCLVRRWRIITDSPAKHLHDARTAKATAAEPWRDELRLVHADWLQLQCNGQGLGEYIRLALGGLHAQWRAELLMELDGDVMGAFAFTNADLRWDRGLIVSANIDSRELKTLLDHPAAFILSSVTVQVIHRTIPDFTEAGPYRVKELTIKLDAPLSQTPSLDGLRRACPDARINVEEIDISQFLLPLPRR